MKDDAIEELVDMGLSEYQSRVYIALTSLGPSGVSEINRISGVPRTKVYETLQELITRGIVEFQAGRPTLYRSIRPSVFVKAMIESYSTTARRAESLLEGRYENVRDVEHDLVWTVRGDVSIRRKLAELLTTAKKSITILEVYPPTFIISVKSVLKSAKSKGIHVRSMCVVSKDMPLSVPESDMIEYRSISQLTLGKRPRSHRTNEVLKDPYMKPLVQTLSGPYAVAIIDDIEVFVMIQKPTDGSRSVGFSAKIPGVPSLMRIMFERLLISGTRIKP